MATKSPDESDPAQEPEPLWDREKVLRECQKVYRHADEARDKLKALDMIMELLPQTQQQGDPDKQDAMRRVRETLLKVSDGAEE